MPGSHLFDEMEKEPKGDDKSIRFISFGAEMHEKSHQEIKNALTKHLCDEKIAKSDLKHVFTHTSSPTHWMRWGMEMAVEEVTYNMGRETGNIVSASVPFGIASAVQRNELKKDQLCLSWVASAGMVFSAATFIY